eukprot:12420139-Karenia_brevis.AAC.2
MALDAAHLKSWSGESTRWMAGRFGDVYPHETCISHIRRLLESKYVSHGVGETFRQFRNRMAKVEKHLNSDEFAAHEGGGLSGLCKELRTRCENVIARQGDRLPK